MNNDAKKNVHQTKTVRLDGEQADLRIDKALALALPALSRATIQRLLKSGQITQGDETITNLAAKGRRGVDYIITIPQPEPTSAVPEEIKLAILHEDSDLIVVNKAAGMVVHPGAGVKSGTLVNALLFHCQGELSGIGGEIRPGIVHRLDKDTSGILVIAKNDHSHQGLAKQFEQRTATRQYLAISKGIPKRPQGVVDAPIGRHPNQRTKMAVNKKGRQAITNYEVINSFPPFALLSCRLDTGRTHQIRVHMAHLGIPLLGDQVYGRPFQPPHDWPEAVRQTIIDFQRQALHAATLEFQHPTSGKILSFQVDPPTDFIKLWEKIKTIPDKSK